MIFSYLLNMQSHPSWVCGLKHSILLGSKDRNEVTPFVGVWIETRTSIFIGGDDKVTPFVGVWIETLQKSQENVNKSGHTLRGCVD